MYKRQVNGLFLGNLNLRGKDKTTSSRRCQPQQAPAAHGRRYQLTGLAITSATVKLPIFVIFSPKAIYRFRNSKVTETRITRARTTRKEVFERGRAGYPYGVFGRQLLQTSHLLLASRLPEQMTAAAGTCPAGTCPVLICFGYVGPPCSGVIFTPPRARLVGSVPVYVT